MPYYQTTLGYVAMEVPPLLTKIVASFVIANAITKAAGSFIEPSHLFPGISSHLRVGLSMARAIRSRSAWSSSKVSPKGA